MARGSLGGVEGTALLFCWSPDAPAKRLAKDSVTSLDYRSSRLSSTAEILLWQARIRLVAAIVLGVIAAALQVTGHLPGTPNALLQAMVAYVAAVSVMYVVVRETLRVSPLVVAGTLLSDAFLVFATTVIILPPDGYGVSLVLAFLGLHLAVYAFGTRVGIVALVLSAVGQALMTWYASRWGVPVSPGLELWTLALFLVAGGTYLHVYGGMSARLRRLVELFERAEEGDFAEAYAVDGDARPDPVTAVGDAYNRVREQLASLVLTDPLTGCLNRRGLDQSLARELSRAARAGSEVSLLALDLDHFKSVNDTRGHLVGDAVLRETGELLRRTVRTGDLVARTGGEEFTILLPDTGSSGAYQLATRLCDSFRVHAFGVAGGPVRLTVSVGAVASDGRTSDRLGEELKHRADQALYAAKRTGRDRVRVWTPSMGVPVDRKSGGWIVGDIG